MGWWVILKHIENWVKVNSSQTSLHTAGLLTTGLQDKKQMAAGSNESGAEGWWLRADGLKADAMRFAVPQSAEICGYIIRD